MQHTRWALAHISNAIVGQVLFNPTESAVKLAFSLTDAGFAPDTRVHVTDLLDTDGNYSGQYCAAMEYCSLTAFQYNNTGMLV